MGIATGGPPAPSSFELHLVDAVTDAVQSGVTAMKVWGDHLDGCEQCRKAIRGRLASASTAQMAAKCCEVGRPLYQAFLARV